MTNVLCGCLLAAVLCTTAVAQAPAPVEKEPHHKVRIDMLRLRVTELTLQSGESTLDHRHEYDAATIAVTDSSTREKSAGAPDAEPRMRQAGDAAIAEYTGKAATHRIENAGAALARFIEVENFKTGGWESTMPVDAPATTVVTRSRSFFVYDVRLGPGAEMSAHDHSAPTIIIVLSGVVENQGGLGQEAAVFQGAGTVIYSSGAHTLRVKGDAPAHLAEVEIR